jgi:hypothetical protein
MKEMKKKLLPTVAYRGGGLGVQTPPPKFQSFDKAEPTSVENNP